jgi:hypothetical protein
LIRWRQHALEDNVLPPSQERACRA